MSIGEANGPSGGRSQTGGPTRTTSAGPLVGAGVTGRAAPFAAAALLAFLTLLAPPAPTSPTVAVAACALCLAIVASASVAPWRRLPAWTQAIPALLFFVVLVLLREAAGGSASGYAPLAMLPVFWLALHGTRAQLVVALACLGATFLVPVVLVGAPEYALSDWRRGVLWVVIGAIVGSSVQRLVAELEVRRRRAQDQVRALSAVAAAVRDLHGPDARHGVCEAAREVAGAAFAVLLEPRDLELVATAQAGVEVPVGSLPLGSTTSGAALAFASGQRSFVADGRRHPAVSQPMVDALGVVSVLFEPSLRGDEVVAVLVVCWQHEIEDLDDVGGAAVALLAAEAGAVLERADLLARVDELARVDALTGLPNRRAWDERIELEVDRARRFDGALTVAVIDLDRFKAYNDSHGHQAGDRVLETTAAEWRTAVRKTDLLARYGGEEFALVLPGCPPANARPTLERLRAAVADGQTCSIGVAVWDGIEDGLALVGRADRALYEAKRTGRDRISVAAGTST